MCSLDALTVVVRTVWYTLSERSFRSANKKIIVQRYTADDDNSGAFQEVRENRLFRWVMFAFAVSQIVKLFALQGPGVLATQVCGSMYLGSFVVIELLVGIPKVYTSIKDLKETISGVWLQYSTVAASTCCVLYTIIHALVSLFEANGLTLDALQSTGLTILICGSVAFVPSGLHSQILRLEKPATQGVTGDSTRQSDNETNTAKPSNPVLQGIVGGSTNQNDNEKDTAKTRNPVLENILLLLILAIPVAYSLLAWLLSATRRDQHPLDPLASKIVAPIMIGTWAMLCLYWARVNFEAVRATGRENTSRVESILSWYFWCLHLVAALLYYRYVYDPAGTVKPDWTDQLG